jgi:multidrug resistance efflux pump
VKLAQARTGLTDLERTQLEALSQFKSKTATLERRAQEANLTIKGARAANGVILERQWLRLPLAGLVSDVGGER